MTTTKVYKYLQIAREWLLPLHCRLCGSQGQRDQELCHGCYSDLPWLTSACSRCAEPLPGAQDQALCGRCLRHPSPFDQVLAPLRFAAPVDQLIHAFKFRNDLAAGRLLGRLLSPTVAARHPDLLLPVPLHDRRLRERGFNQSLELARQLSRGHRIPLASQLLVRRRDTSPQHTLPATARRANIRGAFELQGPLPGSHIAILDDVMTTGETMAEISRVLRRAGATQIEVWVVARA